MPDDSMENGGGENGSIPVSKPNEVRDWARKFAVTEAEVLAAVRAVGDRADDVEAYLEKHKKIGHLKDSAGGRL